MISPKKILVVDDEQKIVDVVKAYLEKVGYEVHAAYNGTDAVKLFEKINPVLIVLDLMLPDISGEDICKMLRKKSRVPIIMLTAKVDEKTVLEGFNIGADDYVTKPFSPKQLVARVMAHLRRIEEEAVPLSNILSFNNGDLVLDATKHEVKKNGITVNLTSSEYNILMTLVKYPQKTFTREELVNLALEENFNGFDRIIDTHIKNLRQKIEDNSREPKYVLTVYKVGYRFGGE
ncbi:response regulator [Clostridium sp. WILCCON 0269]|uniref:Stage 0 sporulation protein A homolog n=1 Tax=Candidatus Clostridium eludens TaxID=3381663 RepID=A0ABW8SRY0_9CLOT